MEEKTTTEHEALRVPSSLKALIEGLVFAAHEPLSARQIKAIYEGDLREGTGRAIETDAIRATVDELNGEYAKQDRPYRILSIAGGFQFATLPEYAEWLGKLYKEQARRRLSQSGVETLAIIAYKQPITKSEIEKIRGVNCDYVLKTLLEKELVTITGRAESVGRPLLYGTTKEFLKHFGLNDVTDLPRPREIEEILGESQFETERRMLEAQAGAEAMKKEAEDFKSRLPHIPKKKAGLEGDVEIVPRKRTREIRITHAPQEKLEEAGQERIEFAPATPEKVSSAASAVPEEMAVAPVATVPETPAPPEVPPVVDEPSVTLMEAASGMPVSPQEPQTGDVPLPEPAVSGEPVPQIEFTKIAESTLEPVTAEETEAAAAMVEFPAPDAPVLPDAYPVPESAEVIPTIPPEEDASAERGPAEPDAEGNPPKNRWRSWKEKIQGFIRKLFG